jgi:ABC-type nickel/cobalt efflux system permease component RcnA
MPGWLPVAMMLTGGLVALASGLAGNIVLMRRFSPAKQQVENSTDAATLSVMSSLLNFAVIAALGLAVLVVGGVIGSRLPAWAFLLPAGLLLLSVGAAWLVRRQQKGLPKSQSAP